MLKASPESTASLRRPVRMSLRAALLRLLLVVAVPLALASAAVLWRIWDAQRHATEQGMLATAKVLVLAVDREHAKARTLLETLGASPFIDAGNWSGLYGFASAALVGHPDTLIALTDDTGQLLLNTGVPWGTSLPNVWQLRDQGRSIEWQGNRLPVSSQGLTQRV